MADGNAFQTAPGAGLGTGAEMGPTTSVDDVASRQPSSRLVPGAEVVKERLPDAGQTEDGPRKMVPGLIQATKTTLDPREMQIERQPAPFQAEPRPRPRTSASEDAGLLKPRPSAAVAGMDRLQMARQPEVGRPREA